MQPAQDAKWAAIALKWLFVACFVVSVTGETLFDPFRQADCSIAKVFREEFALWNASWLPANDPQQQQVSPCEQSVCWATNNSVMLQQAKDRVSAHAQEVKKSHGSASDSAASDRTKNALRLAISAVNRSSVSHAWMRVPAKEAMKVGEQPTRFRIQSSVQVVAQSHDWNALMHVELRWVGEDTFSSSDLVASIGFYGSQDQWTIASALSHHNNAKRFSLSSEQTLKDVAISAFPCHQERFNSSVHVFAIEWDRQWVRWFVDDLFIREEPLLKSSPDSSAKAADESDKSKSQLMEEFSVAFEASFFQAGPTAQTSAADKSAVNGMLVDTVEVSSSKMCKPVLRNAANCRNLTEFVPPHGSIKGCLSVDEVEAFTDSTMKKLPFLTELVNIGESLEQRPLASLCFGLCQPQTSTFASLPQTLYTGMHHSREPLSMMNLVYFVESLVHSVLGGSLEALQLLMTRQLWFVFVVNPDGYKLNEKFEFWQHGDHIGVRKNARDDGCINRNNSGVDLNRNYDVCYDVDLVGSNVRVCDEDYRGKKAFSEPETLAIKHLVERNHFKIGLNYHSFGKFFNVPFACKSKGFPAEQNLSVFNSLAQEMTKYNHFRYGQAWSESNLYTVNGETSDWMWESHGIFAMSPETGPSFEVDSPDGFWPPEDSVTSISEELLYSNLVAARAAGPMLNLTLDQVTLVQKDKSRGLQMSISITNEGVMPVTNPIEIVASFSVNGSSGPLASMAVQPLGTRGAEKVVKAGLDIAVPETANGSHSLALFLLMRSNDSCVLHRASVSTETEEANFEQWQPLPLPPCGTCLSFGRSKPIAPAQDHVELCKSFNDVLDVKQIGLQYTGSTNSTPSSSFSSLAKFDGSQTSSTTSSSQASIHSTTSTTPVVPPVKTATESRKPSVNDDSTETSTVGSSATDSHETDAAMASDATDSSDSSTTIQDVGMYGSLSTTDEHTKMLLLIPLCGMLIMVFALLLLRNYRREGSTSEPTTTTSGNVQYTKVARNDDSPIDGEEDDPSEPVSPDSDDEESTRRRPISPRRAQRFSEIV